MDELEKVVEKKYCRKCDKVKPKSNFYKRSASPDGLTVYCKKCMYAYIRKTWRKYYKYKSVNTFKIEHGISKSKTIEYRTAIKRKHRKNNPEKARCRGKFTWAIIKGRIKKQPCEICGKKKAEGHHDNYSKPLEVRWLCRKHHLKYHKELRDENITKISSTENRNSQTA